MSALASALAKTATAAGALALVAAPLALPTAADAQPRHFEGHFHGGPVWRGGWGPGWRVHHVWWGPGYIGYPYAWGPPPTYWGPAYYEDEPPVVEEDVAPPPPAPAIYEGRAVYPRKVLGYREVYRPRVHHVVHHAIAHHRTTIACAVPARRHVVG